jgi:hypothetical protein
MFGYSGKGHLKRFCNIGDGHIILKQHRKDSAARRIRKSGKDDIEPISHKRIKPKSA